MSHASLRCARLTAHNITAQNRGFSALSLNPTGTPSRRHTAHFVSGIDNRQKNKTVDSILIFTIAKVHAWFRELASGSKTSVNDIALDKSLAANEISRVLPLAFLAPDIVKAIIAGRQPLELTAKRLKRCESLPLDWSALV